MSFRFNVFPTPIQGLTLLERMPSGDQRGWFERMFCVNELNELLGNRTLSQINRSHTAMRGTVRGMHYQNPPHAEMKIVACLKGEVFDVAVDLRPESATRYQWYSALLSADNNKCLVIPEGFAHGYQTLSDNCEMLYFHTAPYHQLAEGGLHPLDPALAIDWPLPVSTISKRDSSHPFIVIP